MSVVCEKIFTKLSQVKYEQVHTDECQYSFIQEWKFKTQTYTTYRVLWFQAPAWVGSYRGKIIEMAKVSL